MNDKELSEIRARHDAMNGQHGVPVAMSHTTAYNRANADRATLLSHIDTLTAERDNYREGFVREGCRNADLRAQVAAAHKRTTHSPNCNWLNGDCSCGLEHKEARDD